MSTPRFPTLLLVAGILATVPPLGFAVDSQAPQEGQDAEAAAGREVTQGALRIVEKDGSIVECPLKHTDVKAAVSGFIARVTVTQTFHNPKAEAIEAVYVFPLPHEAAVDDMTMLIGDRKIVGVIKRRDEAREIYEQALLQGQTAALLEQERPNIFTQSVGNIAPGQEVKIQISYVDVLKYDMGEYEFHFPMVVGPRFIPGAPISSPQPTPAELQGKVSPPVANTNRVPDAERITPPVLRPEVRNAHDISLAVSIDAGVPVQNLNVSNHKVDIQLDGDRLAKITLLREDSLPNKDFVLRYAVVGEKPEVAMLAHTGNYSRDSTKLGLGYFVLMIQPKEDERLRKSPPREMVFLVDVSGSMRGDKTDKTRETMQHMLGLCRENDTVQVMTFANQARKLFDKPLPVNEASVQQALNFTSNLQGSGGTHMLEGVRLAIDEPVDKHRIRIIVMLTDGFIGNESEIIQHVGKHCGDRIRFWTIGIGESPNMFLIDGVARQGGGMGKRLGLKDESEPLSHEVMTRIQRAQLADVSIDWGNMQVLETYPARIPELWAGRPVILFGRYRDGGRHEITISGNVEGEAVQWPLTIDLPKEQAAHDVLAKVWARRKIEDLMHKAFYADAPAVEEEVTALALDYRLMSQYTSFVAVDEREAKDLTAPAKPPRRMLVPVPLPEGAQWEGFFGDRGEEAEEFSFGIRFRNPSPAPALTDSLFSLGKQLQDTSGPDPVRGRWAVPHNPRIAGESRRGAAVRFERLSRVQLAAAAPVRGGAQLRESKLLVSPTVFAGRPELLAASWDGAALAGGATYSFAFLQPQAQELQATAQESMAAAAEFKAQGHSKAERAALVRACFLDQAAANLGGSPGQVAGDALAALEQLHRDQVSAWTKQQPLLARRLELVIRDQSISDALQQIAVASGLAINLVQGSVDDAAALPNNDTRISYLDLRGATVAQALDWVLRPSRLGWRIDDDVVIAGADRRLPGESAWVYDVALIAWATEEELKDMEADKAIAAVQQVADRFLKAARGQLSDADKLSVVWFAPGQMLIFGDSAKHEQALQLLTRLKTGEGRLEGDAGELQAITAKRAEQRRDVATQLTAASKRQRIAATHGTFGWQLLAAAADGRLDDEAFTELKIAWNDPATKELLEGQGRALLIRSLWIVTESSNALPDEPELSELAKTALTQSRPFVDKLFVKPQLENIEDDAALLYAALATRGDDARRLRTVELLTPEVEDASRGKLRVLARSLLAGTKQPDASELAELVDDGVAGEDMVTLTAMACRRAGGIAWQTFRSESQDLIGSQPLPGEVVVLVDRLAMQQLPLTRTTR